MTAEPDLLPPLHYDELPETPEDIVVCMRAYARACVSSATEALRRDRDDCLAAREHYAGLYGEQLGRAERLAEALREIQDDVLRFATADTVGGDLDAMRRAMARLSVRISAALHQETLIERMRAVAARTNDPLLLEAAAALEAAREDASTERRALLWLAGGDSGSSSEAICHHMLGMKCDGSFPHDPADLGRCLRLLELFPEWKPRIREMARYSPYWAALVARWDELAEMMADEVGIDWSKGKRAPRTYDAMQAAIDQARGKAGQEETNG